MKISIGKLRGLQQVADDDGFMTICALDHRGALRRSLNEQDPKAVKYQDMVEFKLDLCRAVAGSASAVLLDPQYGAAQAIAAGVLPGRMGLLVSIEKTGYSGESTARITEVLPDWSVKKIKRMGASAVKLLVYFRPDLKETASRQLDLVARLAEDCIQADIAFLVEPVSYPTEDDERNPERFARMKPELVIDTARQMTSLPIDVLKAEFPADLEYEKDEARAQEHCRELDRASKAPWALLSAGVGFEQFQKQVELASKAGASGFLAGRALWQEGARIRSRQERMDFFRHTAAPRLDQVARLVRQHGKPWYVKSGSSAGQFEIAGADWYKDY